MADDPDAWPDPWPEPVIYEEWLQEKLRQDKQWLVKHRAQAERERMERAISGFRSLAPAPPSRNPVVREARLEEFKDNPNLRKWAMWRQYKAGGTTLRKVGEDFGIGPERVRQMVAKCDRMLKATLNRAAPGFPAKAEVREATRGVEFVFRNDLTFVGWNGDKQGWVELEDYETTAKGVRKICTYYKAIVPKEQTDATETDDG